MPPRDKIASHFLVLVSLIFTNLDFGNAAGVTKYNQSIPFIVDSLEYFPDGVPPLVPPGYNCTSTPEPPPLNSVFMAAQYFQQEQLGNLTVGAAPWDPAHPGDQANSSCILIYPNPSAPPNGALIHLCATHAFYTFTYFPVRWHSLDPAYPLDYNQPWRDREIPRFWGNVTIPASSVAQGLYQLTGNPECNHPGPLGGPPLLGGSVAVGMGSVVVGEGEEDVPANVTAAAQDQGCWVVISSAPS